MSSEFSGQKVMVVDDRKVNYEEYALLISRRIGCHVECRGSKEDALNSLARMPMPSLVLLDVFLPDRNDGIAVCRAIKQKSLRPEVQVIMVTANSDVPGLLRECLDAGADDFIIRSATDDEKVARIRSKLRAQAQYLKLLESERQLAAAKLAQVEAVEAQKRLGIEQIVHRIGDISHDIKNMLLPLQTGVQTLEMMIDAMFEDGDGEPVRSDSEVQANSGDSACVLRSHYREIIRMACNGSRDAQEYARMIAEAMKGVVSPPKFEAIRISDQIDQIAVYLAPVAKRKRIRIDTTELQEVSPIEADPHLIRGIIYNLIDNAISETPESGSVMVRLRQVHDSSVPGVELQIGDTGNGMPSDIRESILAGDSKSTKPGGTGLGTQIVRRNVLQHQGTLDIVSEEGKGTTFTIWLPLRQSQRMKTTV